MSKRHHSLSQKRENVSRRVQVSLLFKCITLIPPYLSGAVGVISAQGQDNCCAVMMAWLVLVLVVGGARAAQLDCNPQVCPETYRGDGLCDVVCMTAACGYDGLDQGTSDCASACLAQGCYEALDGNTHICREVCDVPECGFDSGACGLCASKCYESVLGDGDCHAACNTLLCQFDAGDCVFLTQGNCASGCFTSMLGNGQCDSACLNSACLNDHGDCNSEACSPGCYPYMINDSSCDRQCRTEACQYDGFDCACNPGCGIIPDDGGICVEACNSKSCNFDNGDCVLTI